MMPKVRQGGRFGCLQARSEILLKRFLNPSLRNIQNPRVKNILNPMKGNILKPFPEDHTNPHTEKCTKRCTERKMFSIGTFSNEDQLERAGKYPTEHPIERRGSGAYRAGECSLTQARGWLRFLWWSNECTWPADPP